jgi:hypothetical protein
MLITILHPKGQKRSANYTLWRVKWHNKHQLASSYTGWSSADGSFDLPSRNSNEMHSIRTHKYVYHIIQTLQATRNENEVSTSIRNFTWLDSERWKQTAQQRPASAWACSNENHHTSCRTLPALSATSLTARPPPGALHFLGDLRRCPISETVRDNSL